MNGFWLFALVLIPFLGALCILWVPSRYRAYVPAIGFVVGMLNVLVVAWCWSQFDATSPVDQFQLKLRWLPILHVSFRLALDGINILFVLLVSLLVPFTSLLCISMDDERLKSRTIALLMVQVGAYGFFLSRDLFLLFVSWELMTFSTLFLNGSWGRQSFESNRRFAISSAVGSVFLGMCVFYMGFRHETFHISELVGSFSVFEQKLCFVLMVFAFVRKAGLFPFHAWFPHIVPHAPVSGAVLIMGILIPSGVYAVLRVMLPLAPAAFAEWGHILMFFVAFGGVYASLLSLVQIHISRRLSYIYMSYMSFSMLGALSLRVEAVQGALVFVLFQCIAASGLLFLFAILRKHFATSRLAELGGVAKRVPSLTTYFVLFVLSLICLPGLAGFSGEFLLLLGLLSYHPVFAIAFGLSSIFGVLSLWELVRQVFFGAAQGKQTEEIQDISRVQSGWLVVFLCLLLWGGWSPHSFTHRTSVSVSALVIKLQQAVKAHRVMRTRQRVEQNERR
ncbi:MAG TPA: hypothetical protein DCE42_16935 [Myxococcales bacterium]|nr:hypothetical protein [Deltaproteobacteria bacterium]HAA56454.1 hypothetical protein [Myxococcales bacterium]|tara:strand:- start:186 stop:1703 length:1518 start_codon:yes stop_codon:yes gene_type:complete